MTAECPYILQWDVPSPLKIECLYTPYNLVSNRLSSRFDNRFDSWLYRVYKHSTSCQTGL